MKVRSRWKSLALVLMLSALVGCEAAINPPTPPPPEGSSVAVLPLLGGNFAVQHVGFTIFENGEDSCAAAPLDPDAFVRDAVQTELRTAAPGIRLIDLACSANRPCGAEDFPTAYQWSLMGGPGAFDVANISSPLRESLAKTSADRVLIVARQRVQEGEPNLAAYIDGLGIFHRSLLGLLPRGYAHASLRAVLVDGRTLETISSYHNVTKVPLNEAAWSGADCAKLVGDHKQAMDGVLRQALTKGVTLLLSHFGMSRGATT